MEFRVHGHGLSETGWRKFSAFMETGKCEAVNKEMNRQSG